LADYQTLKEATEEQLTALSEPAQLAAAAIDLGMAPAPATGYLVLAEGVVTPLAPAGEESAEGQAAEGQAAEESATGEAAPVDDAVPAANGANSEAGTETG
jgi:hypothetical protein